MTETGPIALQEGDLVAGKYRVEGVIGVGGMGVVVAARHVQLGQRVAIKLVRDLALRNEEAVQRFLREARAAVRLKSEHAARVLDVGTLESGVPYMVMEFLDGSDLGQVLSQRGPVPVEVAAEWVAQACEAVAEAHAAGIVHRDLKPQNLFLARTVGGSAQVKVLDFGVSKSIESMVNGPGALTRTRSMLGSPLYMAPEQMRSSRDVDARADVWALGVVLFELLTQRLPFEAETLPALCLKVVSDPPLSLSELRPDVPETMLYVVERCLAKEAAQRFANAAELASALEPLVPAGARRVVERARMAMASVPEMTPPLESGALDRPRTPIDAKVPARASPTPASWGSKLAPKGKRGAGLWVGAGVLAVAGVAGAVALIRGRSIDAPPAAPASSESASVATTAPAPGNAAGAGPIAVVALAPPLGEATPSESASAPAESASGRVGGAPSAIVAPALPIGGRAPAVRLPIPAKPPARDDDIPALR